jgi:hypothetical protein
MTTIDDIYAGDYITADELPDGRRIPAVIVFATVEEVGQDQRKRVVLTLRAPDGRPWPRRLVLNKTNAGLIAAVAGKEFATWPGRPLEVWKEPVSFQGKIVSGVKVSAMPTGLPAGTSLAIPMPASAARSGNGGAAGQAPADGYSVPFPGAMPGAPAADTIDDEIPL